MPIKIWTSIEKYDDKIIAYLNDTIYKANPPVNEIEAYVLDMKMQNNLAKNFFGIPLHYISEINMRDGKKYIEVVFRGDYEHLKIKDDRIRNEIFEFLKKNIPGAIYSIVKLSKFKTAKKPLIAMGVVCTIFLWCLYIAIGIQSGNEYDVTNQHYHSVAGIVLLIASLGVNKITFIFGFLLIVAGISFLKKYRNPIVKNTISIKH
jgi:hypothetical protein